MNAPQPDFAATLPAIRPPESLSTVIGRLGETDAERISIAEMVAALGDRSFSTLMILFAVPNMVPFIPGSSTVLGLVLALLGLQLVLGHARVRLPRRLGDRTFDAAAVRRLTGHIVPWLRKFERMARPRYWPEIYRVAERLAGIVVILLSVMVMLPIPLANGLPSLAICMIALGISERDGLWLAGGILSGVLVTGVLAGFFLAGYTAALTFW